jgi:hypothetical protein
MRNGPALATVAMRRRWLIGWGTAVLAVVRQHPFDSTRYWLLATAFTG